jgi:hypothetical protein
MSADRPAELERLSALGTRTAPLGAHARILAGVRAGAKKRRHTALAMVLVVGFAGAAAAAMRVLLERPQAGAAPASRSRTVPTPTAAPLVLSRTSSTTSLGSEEQLIRDAQRLVASGGDPAVVEALLAEYLREYPQGLYEEEARYYLFLVASRSRDGPRAHQAAQAFLARFPAGHRADRVRAWLDAAR